MDVNLGVLADFASISREGKLNIMGIFDEINVSSLPAALPVFYVVVTLVTRATEFETDKSIEIALQDEDGNIRLRVQQDIHVPRPEKPGTRGIIHQVHALLGLAFERAGSYEFVVSIDGRPDSHTIPLRVNVLSEGAAQ